MTWLTSPIVPYALFALLLVFGIGLYFLSQRDKTANAAAQRALREDLQGHLEFQAAQIRRLSEQLEEMRASTREPAPVVRNPVSQSRRTQVLSLHRSGEPPAGIAAILNMPRPDVELMIKLHSTLAR